MKGSDLLKLGYTKDSRFKDIEPNAEYQLQNFSGVRANLVKIHKIYKGS